MAGFCYPADCLYSRIHQSGANLPKVSSSYHEYSHFWETDAGDSVRYPLRGAGRSQIRYFSAVQEWPCWGPSVMC
jgi:hypothetical protein